MKNEPAFPTGFITDPRNGQIIGGSNGMTLRDYFAAKAMQASRSRNSKYRTWDDLAQDSYDIADAMLKAREV